MRIIGTSQRQRRDPLGERTCFNCATVFLVEEGDPKPLGLNPDDLWAECPQCKWAVKLNDFVAEPITVPAPDPADGNPPA
jgi:hypothetical protein